jgi:hypothetical protein
LSVGTAPDSDRSGAGSRNSWRSTNGAARNTPADPRDEHCKPTVGSAAGPWRASQARHQYRQTSVAKYMVRQRHPPSQGCKTFIRNHADGIGAIDLFVVPTISFRLLYGLLIMGHGRRQILWFGVTSHPTAEWIADQLTEACGWEQVPHYLIRDRDGAYGEVFIRGLRSMGIRDRPASSRSPWKNGFVERLIGSIGRECLDHVCVWRAASSPCATVVYELL